jgi:hypothetical protein
MDDVSCYCINLKEKTDRKKNSQNQFTPLKI